jgi:alpha-D-glucose phosphate-specific phosphoglucomutase
VTFFRDVIGLGLVRDEPPASRVPRVNDELHPRRPPIVDLDRLTGAYYDERPDPSDAGQRVSFGTSGHRGSSLARTFNEAHVLAMSAAVCRYRRDRGIDGPLFLGRDTHALSEPAFRTILEVLAAQGVDVMVDAADGFTPTPVICHAIVAHNRLRTKGLADGIVVTPSHNPPEDGASSATRPTAGLRTPGSPRGSSARRMPCSTQGSGVSDGRRSSGRSKRRRCTGTTT